MDFFEEAVFRNIPDTGLYLVNHNTGTGKTTATVNGMYRLARDSEFNRLQVFSTGKWVNIPFRELEDVYKTKGHGAVFETEVLVLRSSFDTFRDLFELSLSEMPVDLSSHSSVSEIRNLFSMAARLKEARIQPGGGIIGLKLRDNVMSQIGVFRNVVSDFLSSEYKDLETRRASIRPGGAHSWVGRLFPSARFSDPCVKILMMTTEMLLRGGAAVIDRSFIRYLSDIPEASVIYLDEFDDSKQIMLNHIINDSIQNDFDLVHAFSNAYHWLCNQRFDKSLIEEPEKRRTEIAEKRKARGASVVPPLESERTRLVEEISKQKTVWRSDAHFRKELDTKKAGMLFSESFSSRCAGIVGWRVDLDAENINVIRPPDTSGANKMPWLQDMLRDFSRLFRRFIFFCKHVAENATSKAAGGYGAKFQSLFASKFESVLSLFYLDPGERETARRIVDATLQRNKLSGFEHEDSIFPHFYQRGFSISSLVDSDDHEFQTMIKQYSLPMMSEQIIYILSKRSFVVGLSATSTIPSVISNFDLAFLRTALGDSFRQPTDIDFELRHTGYLEHTSLYRKSGESGQTHHCLVETIDPLLPDLDESSIIDLWSRLGNLAYPDAERLYNQTMNTCAETIIPGDPEMNDFYVFHRYHRAFQVLSRFASEKDNRACLAFFQILARKGKPEFDLTLLCNMAEVLNMNTIKDMDTCDYDDLINQGRPVLAFLTKEEILAGVKGLKRLLSKKIRVIAFTAYATSGLGVNLQYELEDEPDLIKHSKKLNTKETDWNGIYLDKPTNIIPNFTPCLKGSERLAALLKRISCLLYLFQDGSLSWSDTRVLIESSMDQYENKKPSRKTNVRPLETRGVRYATLTVIIQALGRLERTGQKHRKQFIMLDASLIPVLEQAPLPSNMSPLNSFSAVMDYLVKSGTADASREFAAAIGRRAEYANDRIQSVLRQGNDSSDGWPFELFRLWINLRQECVKNPVRLRHVDRPEELRWYFFDSNEGGYQQLKSYGYREEGDFLEQTISFDPGYSRKEWAYVSEEASGLPFLMRNPVLINGFKRRGYAVSWESGASFMYPVIFNNIYKGMLGESALRVVLEDFLEYEVLEDTPETIEKFDMITARKICFDSKFWMSQIEIEDREHLINEYLKRLDFVGGQHAVLIRTAVVDASIPLTNERLDPGGRITVINRLFVKDTDSVVIDPEALSLIAEIHRRSL